MKLPDIFIPEKNLDGQTESLKHPKEIKLEKIKKLTDLVIYEGLRPSRFGTYKDLSSFLKIIDSIFIEYGTSRVEIVEFIDDNTLKSGISDILKNTWFWYFSIPPHVMIKDVYAGFIHTEDKNEAKEIIDNYVKKFGFEAHEIISKTK